MTANGFRFSGNRINVPNTRAKQRDRLFCVIYVRWTSPFSSARLFRFSITLAVNCRYNRHWAAILVRGVSDSISKMCRLLYWTAMVNFPTKNEACRQYSVDERANDLLSRIRHRSSVNRIIIFPSKQIVRGAGFILTTDENRTDLISGRMF